LPELPNIPFARSERGLSPTVISAGNGMPSTVTVSVSEPTACGDMPALPPGRQQRID
ncbi:hypothetical protein BAE44_0007486, partial [Dichanthelium oligosanthes]